jgi:hypothetical protein
VTKTAEMAARRGSSMTHPIGSNSPSPEWEVDEEREDVLVADPLPPVVVEGTPAELDFAAADSASSDSKSSVEHGVGFSISAIRNTFSRLQVTPRLTIDILIITRLGELVRVFFNVRP